MFKCSLLAFYLQAREGEGRGQGKSQGPRDGRDSGANHGLYPSEIHQPVLIRLLSLVGLQPPSLSFTPLIYQMKYYLYS